MPFASFSRPPWGGLESAQEPWSFVCDTFPIQCRGVSVPHWCGLPCRGLQAREWQWTTRSAGRSPSCCAIPVGQCSWAQNENHLSQRVPRDPRSVVISVKLGFCCFAGVQSQLFLIVTCEWFIPSFAASQASQDIYIYIWSPLPQNPPFIISIHMLHKCLLARTINQRKNFVFESGHTEKIKKNNILGLFGEGPLEKKKKTSKKENIHNILGLFEDGPLEKKKKTEKQRTLWGGPLGEKIKKNIGKNKGTKKKRYLLYQYFKTLSWTPHPQDLWNIVFYFLDVFFLCLFPKAFRTIVHACDVSCHCHVCAAVLLFIAGSIIAFGYANRTTSAPQLFAHHKHLCFTCFTLCTFLCGRCPSFWALPLSGGFLRGPGQWRMATPPWSTWALEQTLHQSHPAILLPRASLNRKPFHAIVWPLYHRAVAVGTKGLVQ